MAIDDTYYRYSKLPPNHIRLLQIHRVPDNDAQSIIVLSMKEYDLRTAPRFNALSYTWGPPTLAVNKECLVFSQDPRCYPFMCSGRLVRGTQNLRDALIRIRREKAPDAAMILLKTYFLDISLPIWIDALCINQDDEEERSQQVAIMDEIFRSATCTIGWLGRHDQHSRVAMIMCKKIATFTITHPLPKGEDITPGSLDHGIKTMLLKSSFSHMAWIHFAMFMKRNWFSRTWILQEIALSRSIVLLCGTSSIDWYRLYQTANYVALSLWQDQLHENLKSFVQSQDELRPLLSTRAFSTSSLSEFSRIFYINSMRNSKHTELYRAHVLVLSTFCSDPRDKIYAIRGTSSDLKSITPDYSVEIVELYTEAWFTSIQNQGNLKLLFVYQTPTVVSKLDGLPSWCPDLNQNTHEIPLHTPGARFIWCADEGLRSSDMKIQLRGRTLRVQGLRLSSIVESFDLNKNRRNEVMEPFWSPEVIRMASHLPPPRRTYGCAHQSKFEVLWRTLIAGTITEGLNAHPEIANAAFASFSGMVAFLKAQAPNIEGTTIPADFLDSMILAFGELQRSDGVGSSVLPDILKLKRFLHGAPTVKFENGAYDISEARYSLVQYEASLGINLETRTLMTAWHRRHWQLARGRALVRTDDGCLGLTADCVKPGDEIWVLDGLGAPCLLRPMPNGHYQFCGCAYIHGIMFGEAVADDRNLTTIDLD